MDIGIFDNLDDDGQLTLFGLEEDFGELLEPLGGQETGRQPVREKAQESFGELPDGQGSTGIRIRRCSSCGKLLFVREEDGCYYSACNACGIQYVQK